MRDYHQAGGLVDGSGAGGFAVPFQAAYADRLFQGHLANGDALCLVHDVDGVACGLLLAVAFDHPFGPVRLSKDTMWWIDPAHRGGTAAVRMLDAYELWSKEQGCTFAGMAGMGEDPNIDTLLKRRGYAVAEKHYLKRV